MTLSPSNTAAILLAAGAASRFGGDKLAAPLRGGTVLGHAASALAAAQCAWRTIVVSPARMDGTEEAALGFARVVNPDAADGLSTSIRAGVSWAEARGAKAVLIALADMPFIDPGHYARLFDAANGGRNQCAFTLCKQRRSPPTLFGAGWFPQLKALSGDSGARVLLADQPYDAGVAAPEDMLDDIDAPDDLR